jgi:hypothetical protein
VGVASELSPSSDRLLRELSTAAGSGVLNFCVKVTAGGAGLTNSVTAPWEPNVGGGVPARLALIWTDLRTGLGLSLGLSLGSSGATRRSGPAPVFSSAGSVVRGGGEGAGGSEDEGTVNDADGGKFEEAAADEDAPVTSAGERRGCAGARGRAAVDVKYLNVDEGATYRRISPGWSQIPTTGCCGGFPSGSEPRRRGMWKKMKRESMIDSCPLHP